MVPDALALALAYSYAKPGLKMLDPFCGSGRLIMAAAARGANCVGADANPLACLLTRAKAAQACLTTIAAVAKDAERISAAGYTCEPLMLRDHSKVQWFSRKVAAELTAIVAWINNLGLNIPERLVVGAALSAAARDASWCRKGGWKLHRLAAAQREAKVDSAWGRFAARLRHYLVDAKRVPLSGSVAVVKNDARFSPRIGSAAELASAFDLVLTSPPYGDSKSTVQYGAASGLCLDVVSRINGFEELFTFGRDIDASCLGGSARSCQDVKLSNIRRYWAGSPQNAAAARVERFFADFWDVCYSIGDALRPEGIAVLVIGRRSTGGFRTKLDEFAMDAFGAFGMRLVSCERRPLKHKRLPSRTNRYGRAQSEERRSKGRTKTIADEIILTFEKA